MIVADTNVLAARMLVSELSDCVTRLEVLDNVWLVPRLWRCEFLNILATQIKAGRMTQPNAALLFGRALQILEPNERDPDAPDVLALLARHRITAYDAHFVALAREVGCPLITEDAELLRKFPGLAFSVEAFLARAESPDSIRETPTPYEPTTQTVGRPSRQHPVRQQRKKPTKYSIIRR